MGALTAKGLVLKETPVGEADKILTILLKEYGKMSVSARGARKTNSKTMSAAQLFCYSDCVVYSGKGFYSLASAQPIDNFYGISSDYDKLRAGSYVLELADRVLMENENCDEILRLLLTTLKALERGVHAPEIVRSVCEFKFMQLNGYSPEVSVCSACGGGTGGEAGEIFFGEFGAVCAGCCERDLKLEKYEKDVRRDSWRADRENFRSHIRISPSCVNAVAFILARDIKDLFSFKINNETGAELIAAAGFFLNAHLDVRLNSKR